MPILGHTKQCNSLSYNANPWAYKAVAYIQQGNYSLINYDVEVKNSTPQATLITETGTNGRCACCKTVLSITSLKADLSTCLQSDSRVILTWINGKKTLKPFVYNCVNEI